MLHRLEKLQRRARKSHVWDISLWDVENNAVRIFGYTSERWVQGCGDLFQRLDFQFIGSRHDAQLENLAAFEGKSWILRLSIHSGAYAHQANIITEYLHNELESLFSGVGCTHNGPRWQHTKSDMILKGEGELALLGFKGTDTKHTNHLTIFWQKYLVPTKSRWHHHSLRPLVQNLDDLQFHTHREKYFIHGSSYMVGDPMHGDPVFKWWVLEDVSTNAATATTLPQKDVTQAKSGFVFNT